MKNSILNNLYKKHKNKALFGRYINLDHIEPLLNNLSKNATIDVIGHSVNQLPIYSVTIGKGTKKVLMWSQMHGNESTTTKAVFDMLNVLNAKDFNDIIEHCTIKIIPILNPDGAKAYTRINANAIDLNRDAQDLTQPESKVLRDCFNSFKPDFCFNLHGQRTMYSAGSTSNTATLSFLAPAEDDARKITLTRKKAMEIIVAINNTLQQELPNQVGRYDDGFNINCVGDTFQSLKSPTVLFEAGHYKNDYNREEARHFVFKSLLVSLDYIANNKVTGDLYVDYFLIPENDKLFFDIIIRKANINNQILDIGINYKEVLKENNIHFQPEIIKIEDLSNFYCHKVFDANNCNVFTIKNEPVYIGYANDFVMINNEELSLKV